jgi:hypothetical protein
VCFVCCNIFVLGDLKSSSGGGGGGDC